MKILAGMTANRTHITSAGAPTKFAEQLNNLVVDSLATISKVMKKEFRGASLGKFKVHDFEYERGMEYITLYTPPYDTPAIVSIQIRADSFRKVLDIGPWIYDADAFYDGEELDYYNKCQGEIKFEDISDIEESLEYALLNSNVVQYTLPEFKKAVSGFAKYLEKEIGSKIKSSAKSKISAAKFLGRTPLYSR